MSEHGRTQKNKRKVNFNLDIKNSKAYLIFRATIEYKCVFIMIYHNIIIIMIRKSTLHTFVKHKLQPNVQQTEQHNR